MNNQNSRANKQRSHSDERPSVIIVTGLSGAGKTSVMRALEDLDYYCVDNLPLPLVSSTIEFCFNQSAETKRMALGIDARGHAFFTDFMYELERLKKQYQVTILFLSASITTILRRFQETRRKHPLEKGGTLLEAIEMERAVLMPLIDNADLVIDTDRFNIHEVRRWVVEAFTQLEERAMVVNIVSFGFKHGVPAESNFVYDLRSLPNPYFIQALKPLSGQDPKIVEHLFNQQPVIDYWEHLSTFLHFCLQKSFEEGRFFVTVAIGCTGGRHRSVAFVERVAQQRWPHMRFVITHRDISR